MLGSVELGDAVAAGVMGIGAFAVIMAGLGVIKLIVEMFGEP